MVRLARFLKDFKGQTIFGPIFKLAEAIFELIVPLVMASIIDIGVKNQDGTYVLKMGVVLLLLGIIGLACSLTCQRLAAQSSQGFGTVLRNAVFHHIHTLSYREIDQFGTPSLVTRLTNDINQLQLAVAMLIRLVIRAPFLAIGAIFMAIRINWKISLFFLGATFIIALFMLLIMKKSIPFYRVMQKKLDKIALLTRENLAGARVIRAFSGQKREEERFATASTDYTETAIRVNKISALLNPVTYVIINLAIAAILWFGGGQVETGELTQGEIIALVNYMTQTLQALVVMVNLVVIFTKASASAARVNEILDAKTSLADAIATAYPPIPSDKTPQIEFQAVSFSYHSGKEYAVQHLSFSIAAGETIGIIGATGAGKSTLVHLIPRFYDPSSGTILLDGVPLNGYSPAELRHKIAIVPQKAVLFSGTIADNLRWGNPNATESELWTALQVAQAFDFVNSKPDQLQTVLTQGGKNISGGQKQRLTIARALVANPAILILDDSASALDFATDAALRKSLRQWNPQCTQIVVSQRISTIKNASKILVMEDGALVGKGTHETLLADCPVYQEICNSQFKKEGLPNES